MENLTTRRNLIKAAAVTAVSYSRIVGANDRLAMSIIGTGRRSRDVGKALLGTGKVDIVGLCDIYDVQRKTTQQALGITNKFQEWSQHEFALSQGGVDAVLIATPDHLHLDIAQDALKARKHVYLEKPAVHKYEEGNALMRAAKASDRVMFVGTQQRSGAHYKRAKEEIFDKGKLGKVLFVRANWSNFPWQARTVPNEPKPGTLDWPRFLGRAPYHDWLKARYESWRTFPDYGGGVFADILNHWADVAQWMLDDARPIDAVSSGGIYVAQDGRGNPDTVNAIVRYSKGWNLTFESSVQPVESPRPSVEFRGTEGTFEITRTDYIFRPHKGDAVQVKAEEDLDLSHAKNFVAACLNGSKPSAGVEEGLAGLLPCHMARAAYWTGSRARYDAGREMIITS